MKYIIIKTVAIALTTLSLHGNAANLTHPITQKDATESMVKARIECQKLKYDSSDCMNSIKDATYLDPKVSSLCFSKTYDKLECAEEALNKFYIEEEVSVCKAKTYNFIDCITEMGTPVKIVPEEDDNDNTLLKEQLALVRSYMQAGRHNDAYRLILSIERGLE
ncbi:hypothetical protein GW915_04775 [bacterium]|nr:hypothetical protein [bacterium]